MPYFYQPPEVEAPLAYKKYVSIQSQDFVDGRDANA